MGEVGDHYRTTRERVTELLDALEPGDGTRAVPACPGWTVHDLLAHMTGVPDDALNGRLDGIATDPWTAAQVERGRALSVTDLVTRWSEQGPVFEGFPLPPEAVVDLTTHEQDLRGALDRPGARDSDELLWAFVLVADRTATARAGSTDRGRRRGLRTGRTRARCCGASPSSSTAPCSAVAPRPSSGPWTGTAGRPWTWTG